MSDTEETKHTLVEVAEKDNVDELKRVLEDMETMKYCKTSILHEVRFMTTEDKFVFDSLPLTNSQKEELLLSLYSTEGKADT
jgi:hypothetical protein